MLLFKSLNIYQLPSEDFIYLINNLSNLSEFSESIVFLLYLEPNNNSNI